MTPTTDADQQVFRRGRSLLLLVLLLLACLIAFITADICGLVEVKAHYNNYKRALAWLSLPLLLFLFPLLAMKTFKRQIEIILDSEGIQDHLGANIKILWTDIIDVAFINDRRQFLVLNLQNREKYAPKGIRAWLCRIGFEVSGGDQIRLGVANLKHDPHELLQAIRVRIEEQRKLVNK